MRVAWSVDEATVAAVWGDATRLTPAMAPVEEGEWVLDLGGGNGDFAATLRAQVPGLRIVSTDVERDGLRNALPGVGAVQGDALALPFCDGGVAALTARAILHHVPEDLPTALGEARRVLKPGGRLVVQEPCSRNALANLARRLFPTERHEEGEEPLDPDALEAAVGGAFRVVEVRRHFLTSYLMPHLAGRAPRGLRRLVLGVARALARLDKDLLHGSVAMRRRCAYITIVGEKTRPDDLTIDK